MVRVGFGLVVFMPYQNQNIISTEDCFVSGVGSGPGLYKITGPQGVGLNRLSGQCLVPG